MPLVIKDRVRETSTTTGTGTLTLAGAVASYQAFSVIGDGNTCYYCIVMGTDWEAGLGTYTASGATLARTIVLDSSNAGALVNFGAGTKDVFSQFPADISPTLIGKNEIINGDMTVWQRGTSFAAPFNNVYTADRYQNIVVGAAVVTISRDTDVPTFAQSGHLSNYSLKIDVTTIDASIAAGDFSGIATRIEGYNFLRLAQRPMTLSFWAKAVKTGIYCASLRNGGFDRSYVAEFTINAASTWEKKTITIPASPSAGTWDYTNGTGLIVSIVMACGSTYQTTANAWQTGNYVATSNQVNGVDDVANNFWLSQVKLEAGEVATLFESLPFDEELAACQRYYQKSFAYGTAPAQATGVYNGARYFISSAAGAVTVDVSSILFPVQMRAAPTVVFYNIVSANAFVRNATRSTDATTTAVNAISDSSLQYTHTGLAAWAVNDLLVVHWAASAEL